MSACTRCEGRRTVLLRGMDFKLQRVSCSQCDGSGEQPGTHAVYFVIWGHRIYQKIEIHARSCQHSLVTRPQEFEQLGADRCPRNELGEMARALHKSYKNTSVEIMGCMFARENAAKQESDQVSP